MVPLGNMAKVIGGFAFKSKEFINRGIPIVRISNIIDGNVDISIDSVYYPKESLEQYKDYQLQDGDILIAMSGATTGKIGIVKKEQTPSLLNQRVGKFVIKDSSLLKEYLYWVARSSYYQNALWNYAAGCAQPNVSSKQLESIEIPVPLLPAQRKIASILEKTESAREKRKEADRLTNEFLKSAFLEMFGDPIKNTKKWECKKLGKALDIRDGTHDTPKYITEGIPLVTSKNLKDGEIDFDNIYFISQTDYEQIIKRSFVENGDILYGMIGTIGSPVIVNTDRKFGIKNVALFKFSGRKVNNYYIKTLFEDDLLTKKLLSEKRGGTQKFVSLDILRNFEIPLPPINLQQKFADLVQKVEKLKEKQQESEKELNNLFNSLMQKAFK